MTREMTVLDGRYPIESYLNTHIRQISNNNNNMIGHLCHDR